MLKAIIFDMDGVLIESIATNWMSFAMFFEKYGVDINHSNQKRYLGRSLSDQLKMRKEEYNIQEDIILEDFQKKCIEYQMQLMKDILHPNPSIQKIINEAKERGIKIGVATSSSKNRAMNILTLIGVYPLLDAFVTCEDVQQSKPNPDIFLKAAETLDIEPENCLVIEDAVNGIQAAKAAGMKSAGKTGRNHTKEELSIADMVFSDFNEITIDDLEKLFT